MKEAYVPKESFAIQELVSPGRDSLVLPVSVLRCQTIIKYGKNKPMINPLINPPFPFSTPNTWPVIILRSHTIDVIVLVGIHFLPCRVDDVCPNKLWPDA